MDITEIIDVVTERTFKALNQVYTNQKEGHNSHIDFYSGSRINSSLKN